MKQETNDINVAKFTNGTLRAEQGAHAQWRSYEENPARDRKSTKRMLVAEVGESTYVGQNFGPLVSTADQLCKYMVGVVDRKSGKMAVYDAKMLNLHPHTEREDDGQEDEKIDKTYRQKVDSLTAAFGSKKKKSAMDSRLKNKLSAEKLQDAVGAAVGQTLARPDATHILREDTAPGSASVDLPPHNMDATSPALAYPLAGIVSDEELEALQTAATEFIQSTPSTVDEWAKSNKFPRTVCRYLRVLPISESARMRKACLVLYLTCLLRMYKLRPADLKKKDLFPNLQIPSLVEKSLLNKFTLKIEGSRQRAIPSRLKDRLVLHTLVLCLHLDEFSLEYLPLCEDLALSKYKVTGFLRGLGCSTSTVKSASLGTASAIATLKVPLVFPEVRVRKANR